MQTGEADALTTHCCGADCSAYVRGRWLRYARAVRPEIARIRREYSARARHAKRWRTLLLWARPTLAVSMWQSQMASVPPEDPERGRPREVTSSNRCQRVVTQGDPSRPLVRIRWRIGAIESERLS